jgi:hypothetical protein
MLNLFIQVPVVVRKRLARRCKELYEYAWQERAASEGADEGEAPQVGVLSVVVGVAPTGAGRECAGAFPAKKHVLARQGL